VSSMSGHDEIPEDVAYAEFTFNGVVHRVPVTPEQARRWLEGRRPSAWGAVSRSWTRTVGRSSITGCRPRAPRPSTTGTLGPPSSEPEPSRWAFSLKVAQSVDWRQRSARCAALPSGT
jgi:hypothetical protein